MKRIFFRFSLFILTATMLVESERPKFRSDYRYEKVFKAFYKMHRAAVPWRMAKIRCEAEGAQLMVPESLDEADAMPVLMTDLLPTHEGAYVGIHDLYSEKMFVTLHGESVRGTILDMLWESRQPRHGGGRCVVMRRSGKLFVQPCDTRLPFICKVALARVVYHEECDTFDPRWRLGPNETCYLRHEDPQTWVDAYTTCLLAGGNLAILKNSEEVEYLRRIFKLLPESRVPNEDFAFLGFNDLLQKHHYRTVHGKPLNDLYNIWVKECSKTHEGRKNCGGMYFAQRVLAITDCDTPAIFFCEKPANKDVLYGRNSYGRNSTKSGPSTQLATRSPKRLRYSPAN